MGKKDKRKPKPTGSPRPTANAPERNKQAIPAAISAHRADQLQRGQPPFVAPSAAANPALKTNDDAPLAHDDDTNADIAPIGPTEPGLSAGFGQDQEDYQAAERFGLQGNLQAATVASAPAPSTSAEDIEQQIRDLEARLDRMFGKTRESSDRPTSAIPTDNGPATAAAPERPSAPGPATAHVVLSPEFYARQYGRAGLRSRSEEVDEFGLDPTFEQRLLPTLDFLYDRYFRVTVEGVQHIPPEGRCLIVANHSGGPLPYDGAMLRAAIRREHSMHRELRWLAEDFIYYLPFIGTIMNRIGAVRACQENAERLLNKSALVAVFPEGAKGIGKLYRDRYKLQRFGRGGFIRLCLRTRTPIVPCAIVGAEEANPMLYRIEYMTKALGIPYFPITPTFPALGPVGLLPAPTKWKIRLGEPFTWSGYGTEAADDDILVGRLSERVRASIQTMLDRMISERRSVWFG